MAGIEITLNSVEAGDTPYAVLQQSTGGLGDVWNVTAGAWQASPGSTDRKVTLTQDSQITTSWDAQTPTLGSYTGEVTIHFFDSSDVTYGSATIDVASGDAVTPLEAGDATEAKQDQILTAVGSLGAVAGVSAVVVDDSQTWDLPDNESGFSPQVVSVVAGSTVTLAMDFREAIGGASLTAVNAVSDSESLLTFANSKVDISSRKAHFDVTAGLSAGNEHDISVTVTTNDGQTLVRKGRLHVR